MARVTAEDIKIFNELYYKNKTFSSVARETGFSSSTVSKYVDKNWVPVAPEDIIRFKREDLPPFNTRQFENVENYGELCEMTDEEYEEIKELWKEMAI